MNTQDHSSLPDKIVPYHAFFQREPRLSKSMQQAMKDAGVLDYGIEDWEKLCNELTPGVYGDGDEVNVEHQARLDKIFDTIVVREPRVEGMESEDEDGNPIPRIGTENREAEGVMEGADVDENQPGPGINLSADPNAGKINNDAAMRALGEVESPRASSNGATRYPEPPTPSRPQEAPPAYVAAQLSMQNAAHEKSIQDKQAKVREKMIQKYKNTRNVADFKPGDYVTCKIPKEDRAVTDATRLIGRVEKKKHNPSRYKVKTKHGVIDRWFSVKDLNPFEKETAEQHREALNEAPKTKITLHAAAAKSSTNTKVPTSCSCKSGCKTTRCLCKKREVKCSQYCHGALRSCGNEGTVLEGTEEAITIRVAESLAETTLSTPLAVRTRSNKRARAATASSDKVPKRRRGLVPEEEGVEEEEEIIEDESDDEPGETIVVQGLKQIALSEFASIRPLANRLAAMRQRVKK